MTPPPTVLPDLPLFRHLSREARTLLTGAPRRRFRRGQTLWAAGSEAHALVVVLTGRVRVVRAPGGRQYGVHVEGPGGTLGDVPFFAGGRYPATAIAAEATTCLVLDRPILGRVVAADPELALRLLGHLAGRVRQLVTRLDRQTTRTVAQRLAEFLLEREATAKARSFTLAATQAEAAEDLGTVREVLVRTLRRFREAGLVEVPRRGYYVIRDRGRLVQMNAAPD